MPDLTTTTNTKRLVAYYAARSSASRNYRVMDIPATQLTHVIYAFAGVSASGECISINAQDDAVNLRQLLQLKQQHPKLLTLISVGGTASSASFSKAAATAAYRERLANSCVSFMKQHGFDGIDVAWEFPSTKDKRRLTALLVELRLQLDAQGESDKRQYLLTIASSANSHDYANMELNLIHQYLDWINLTAYDFSVATSSTTNFNAPLFPASDDPSPVASRLTHNVDAVVKAYLEADVPANKLVVGVHFAGTGWQGVPNVNNGLFQTNTGPAKGSWDAAGAPPSGGFGYQDLKTNYLPNYSRYWNGDGDHDANAQVPWLYNPARGIMISYEDPQSLRLKADYVKNNQLGGIMIWEMSADDDQNTLTGILTRTILPATPVVNLAGANLNATVLDDLKIGAPAHEFVNGTLNSVLRQSLASAATKVGESVLATLVQVMPVVDMATHSAVALRDFVGSHVALPTDPNEKAAAEAAIAKLSTTATIGALLGIDQPIKDNPIFLAEVNKFDFATLLKTAPSLTSNPQLADDFIRRYTGFKGPIEDFWNALSQDSEFKAAVPDLQLTLQLDRLTLSNLPLVQVLQTLRHQGKLNSLTDLIKLDAATWTSLINSPVNGHTVAIPANIPGTTLQERTANYVGVITQALRAAFPTAALAQNTASQPAIDPTLVRAVLSKHPKLDPRKRLPAAVDLTALSAGDQAKTRSSWEALRKEVTMFPGLNYQTALGIGTPARNGDPTVAFMNPIRASVSAFLANSPGFDFQTTNIDTYISTNPNALPGGDYKDQTIAQLKTLQRVYRVTPDYQTIGALMGEGLDSAHAISRISPGVFQRRYSGLLGGRDAADSFHRKAQFVTGQSTMMYLRIRDEIGKPGIIGLSSSGPQVQNVLQQNVANWPTLFGSTSSCACDECRAMDGPAAYFVDLLQFIGAASPNVLDNQNTEGYTPLDVLIGYQNNPNNFLAGTSQLKAAPDANPPLGRRPDLPYLKLNCANADTTLPYVDLVNEIMESYLYYVGTLQKASLPTASNNTSLDATSDQLSVNPEYTIQSVYGPAGPLATAFYPFSLPFDRFLTITRNYLEFAGSSLYEVMKTLRLPAPPPSDQRLALEYLKISQNEYLILIGQGFQGTSPQNSPSDLGQYYGYKPGSAITNWLIDISSVANFLRQTGISFEELSSLLYTRFLNPGQSITLQADSQDPCNIDTMRIANLAPTNSQNATDYTTLYRTYRFIRLYTKLGWEIPELDKAISALNTGDINGSLVLAAAQLKQLQGSLKLPLIQLLSLWANIDTDGRDSSYNGLFQNKAVINPADLMFQLTHLAPLKLASLPSSPYPASVTPPLPTAAQISYDQTKQILSFTGTMTDDQFEDLLAWAAPVPNATAAQAAQAADATLAVQNLYNQRWYPGTEVAHSQEPFSAHLNTVLAALQISAEDLTAIAVDAGLAKVGPSGAVIWPPQATLTLANLSTVYRYSMLAQSLSLPVADLISLKTLTGFNPFLLSATEPITNPATQFVQAVQEVTSSKFSVSHLNYLYRAVPDSADTLPPLEADEEQWLGSLSNGLQKIATANVFVPDPAGAALRKKLGVLLPASQVGPTMSLIEGSAVYISPLPGLPVGVILPPGKVSCAVIATITGSITPGDTLTLTMTPSVVAAALVSVPYTVQNGDTLDSVAASLAALINGNAALASANISVTVSASQLYLSYASTSPSPFSSWSVNLAPATATESVNIQYNLLCAGPITATGEAALLGLSPAFQPAVEDFHNQAQDILSQNLTFLAPAVRYSNPLPVFPPGLTLPANGQVSYDGTNLVCTGAMTNPTRVQLLNLPGDANFLKAVNNLYNQAWSSAIANLVNIPANSTPADRNNYVLEGILTYLTTTQSRNLVKQSLSQHLGLGATAIALLLEGNPTTATAALLLSQSLTTQPPSPAIIDFLGGLLATYVPDQNLPTVTKTQIDPGVDLDGTENAFWKAQWFGQIVPLNTDTYTFYAPTSNGGQVQLWVDEKLIIDTAVNPPLTPRISLQAGHIYAIQLVYTSAPAQATIQLQWSNNSMSRQVIPSAAFVLGAAPLSAQNPASSTFVQGGAYSTLSLLNRISVLAKGFSMKSDEMEYLSTHATDFRGVDPGNNSNTALFNLSTLPLDYFPTLNQTDANPNQGALDQKAPALFNLWHRLNSIYTLKAGLPSGNTSLFDVFRDASSGTSTDLLSPIIRATGWSPTDFAALAGGMLDASFVNEITLVNLAACIRLVSRLGVSAEQLLGWATNSNPPAASEAQDIQNTIKAKYDDATWGQVGKTLNDKVRESSKEALIAYILTMPPIAQSGITDADGLYEYFLIDVQMCTCMLTSRIVQATAAVQLFIERCLMNLENGNSNTQLNVAPSQLDAREWDKWRKHFRLWQANREVLLWPEKYYEPTLRDNKTPFFKDLENDLLQGQIDAASVEQAYLNYLHKLDEVARLEMAGLCQDSSNDGKSNAVHVFGRTSASPNVYYYRKLDQTWDDNSSRWINLWTPWARIDVDIQGNQLIPVVWNNRLYIFWPIYTETADPTANQAQPGQATSSGAPTKSLKIQMGWSEYKQGRWGKKQISSSTLSPQEFSSYQYAQEPFSEDSPPFLVPIIQQKLSQKASFIVFPEFVDYFFLSSKVDSNGSLVVSVYVNYSMWTTPINYEIVGSFLFDGYGDSAEDHYSMPIPNPAMGLSFNGNVLSIPKDMTFNSLTELELNLSNPNGGVDNLNILGPLSNPYWLQFPPQAIPQLFPVPVPSGSSGPISNPPLLFWDSHRSYFVSETEISWTDPTKTTPRYDPLQLKEQLVPIDTSLLFPPSAGAAPDPAREIVAQPAPDPQPHNNDGPVRSLPFGKIGVPGYQIVHKRTGIQFYTFYHPHLRDFIQALNVSGLDALLSLQNQELSDMMVHYYTHDPSLRDSWVQDGYNDDGTPFVIFDPNSAPNGTIPLYQLLNGAPPDTYFSVNVNEQQALLIAGLQKQGTGIVGYVYPSQAAVPGTTPLYRLSSPDLAGPHFYTIYPIERDNAINWYGYQLDPSPDGILCYVIDPQSPLAENAGTMPIYQMSATDFEFTYQPDPNNVAKPYPKADVDFSPGGAYSIYNWELFFHIPFLIATKLSQNQRFEEAERFFRFIVDFSTDSGGPVPNRYWNFRPFNQATEPERLEKLLRNMDDSSSPEYQDLVNQVYQYENNPFDPDAIARLRPSAFQKAVVLKYIKHQMAWGDYLYGQNTRESIAEATQKYVRCEHLIGPKPVEIPPTGLALDYTYLQLGAKILDPLSNVIVQMENAFPFSSGPGGNGGALNGGNVNDGSIASAFYFCIPPDDTLLGLWDLVADRLYKIRHCMNLQGEIEQLALFAPPINPALLVAAEAAGVDLSSALSDINAAVPHYRFAHHMPRTLELVSELRNLGGALLATLEKKDAEALAILRGNQELAVLKAVLQIKQVQINEANANVKALNASQDITTARRIYYDGLVSGGWSAFEIGHMVALTLGQVFKTIAQATELGGSTASMLPDIDIGTSGISSPVVKIRFGGSQVGNSASAVGRSFNMLADFSTFVATMASVTGQWDRRNQEWFFQRDTATLELKQIAQQIAAANLRAQIAQQDSDNQQLQIDNASDMMDFLQNRKYTKEELYSWMIDQVSAVYFQCYQMAYDLAKRAETCFRFELGLPDSNYIQFGYWDSLKQGLLCGEKLYLDLKRMEGAYLDQNKREYEITKNISLVLLDPLALITLKETGQCLVTLPETFFDMDYPGHYMRRIKSMGLTIPCVTGPYTNVNCTLTLVQNKIRWDSNASSGYAEKPVGSDPRFLYNFAATQSVATSTAQNDRGLFEVNFHDERYLPFEGAGAVSQWLISMPKDCNAFDIETMTDVILNLKHTARPGGAALRDVARAAAHPAKQSNLLRYFSFKHEFPTEWYQFLHPLDAAPSQTMALPLSNERFPFQYRGKKITISQVKLFLKFKAVYPPSIQSSLSPLSDYSSSRLPVYLAPPKVAIAVAPSAPLASAQDVFGGVPFASIPFSPPAPTSTMSGGQPNPWTLTIKQSDIQSQNLAAGLITAGGSPFLNPEVIDDLFFVCAYSVQ